MARRGLIYTAARGPCHATGWNSWWLAGWSSRRALVSSLASSRPALSFELVWIDVSMSHAGVVSSDKGEPKVFEVAFMNEAGAQDCRRWALEPHEKRIFRPRSERPAFLPAGRATRAPRSRRDPAWVSSDAWHSTLDVRQVLGYLDERQIRIGRWQYQTSTNPRSS